MRILILSNGYPPEQWGGTETYTAGLARALLARGHDVQVLCGGTWAEGASYWQGVRDETQDAVQVRRLDVNWTRAPDPFRYLFDNPVVFHYLREYLRAQRPDVVHVTSCERLSASVISAAKRSRIPVVLSLTDFWFVCPRMTLLRSDGVNCTGMTTAWDCTRCLAFGSKAYRWPRVVLPDGVVATLLTAAGRVPLLTRQRGLRGMVGDMAARKTSLRQAFLAADYRITASAFVRERLVACGFDAPVWVQPYGHDAGWLNRYAGKTPSNRIRLGFAGQLIPQKGAHILLEAIARLDSMTLDRLDVQVFGDMGKAREYGATLRRLAAHLPHVRFRGTYAHGESAEVFANLDALVVPSLWYDFPLIIHEAFASGTPVVASRLGSMAEVVQHEVNGLSFERGDAAALAIALRRFVDEPPLLERLKQGIQPVKTMQQEADEMTAVYGELIARRDPFASRDASWKPPRLSLELTTSQKSYAEP